MLTFSCYFKFSVNDRECLGSKSLQNSDGDLVDLLD